MKTHIKPYNIFSQITKTGFKTNQLFSFNTINHIYENSNEFMSYNTISKVYLHYKLLTLQNWKITISEKDNDDIISNIYQCIYIWKGDTSYYIWQTLQSLQKRMNKEHKKLNSKSQILEFRFPGDYNLTSLETFFIHFFEVLWIPLDNSDKKEWIREKIEHPKFFCHQETFLRHDELIYNMLYIIENILWINTYINFSWFDCFNYTWSWLKEWCNFNMNVYIQDNWEICTILRSWSIISSYFGWYNKNVDYLLTNWLLEHVWYWNYINWYNRNSLYRTKSNIQKTWNQNFLSWFLDNLSWNNNWVDLPRKIYTKLLDGTLIKDPSSLFDLRKNKTKNSERLKYEQ